MSAFLLSVAPLLVLADSYSGPYCYEDVSMNERDPNTGGRVENNVRGTCKFLNNLTSVVSLDPTLQNDYLLAEHFGINGVFCDYSCETTKKSEVIKFATSTNIKLLNENIGDNQEDYDSEKGKIIKFINGGGAILLDKKYVLDYISNVNKNIKLDLDKLPITVILDRNEIKKLSEVYDYNEIVKVDFPKILETKQDFLFTNQSSFTKSQPTIYILNYSDFGRHIYSPTGYLSEYNYVDLDKNNLPNIEFKKMGGGRQTHASGYTVPITSPLSSVTNYWMYTKKDGKLVLQWQKSEYELDNGKVKTITKDDKNVRASMLFSDSVDSSTIPTSASSEIISTSTTSVNVPVIQEKQKSEGFISKLITMILSWFK